MKPRISNQKGFIIADFIFAMTLTAGMSVLLFAISYSLAVVEVTQYVAYSTARAGLGSNRSPEVQKEKALAKYTQLVKGKGAIGSLYSSNWFEAAAADKIDVRGGPTGDGKLFSDDLAGGSDKRNWFIGVSIPLTLKMLRMNLPLIGNTAPEHEDGMMTKINAMLIRDPSEKECKTFMEQRRSALKELPSGRQFYDPGSYFPLEDNGC